MRIRTPQGNKVSDCASPVSDTASTVLAAVSRVGNSAGDAGDAAVRSMKQAGDAAVSVAQSGAESVLDSTQAVIESAQSGLINSTDVVKSGALAARNKAKDAHAWVASRLQEHLNFFETPPSVAALVEGDDVPTLPEGTTLCASAKVKWHGQPRCLVVLELQGPDRKKTPAYQVRRLSDLMEDTFEDSVPKEGPFLWAVHDWRVCEEIQTHWLYDLHGSGGSEASKPRWKRGLEALHILREDDDLPSTTYKVYENQFGPEVAYMFAASRDHVQHLWWLVVICLILIIIDTSSSDVNPTSEFGEVPWIVGLFAVWLWGLVSCIHMLSKKSPKPLSIERKVTRFLGKPIRSWAKIVFIGIPMVVLYFAAVILVFISCTSLTLHVIYVWGECLNKMQATPGEICRDPSLEHGILGTIAEISCDIVLVILFELCAVAGDLFGEWMANLSDIHCPQDRSFFIATFMAGLATCERLGFIGTLALGFAPEWSELDSGTVGFEVRMDADCSDIPLSSSVFATFCIKRKIGGEGRRYLFEKLMKGPFMVAPFVGIIIKVLLPMLVNSVLYGARRYTAQYKLMGPFRTFWRVAALIFSFHGGNVGGLKFVRNGWPFTDLVELQVPPQAESPTSPVKNEEQPREGHAGHDVLRNADMLRNAANASGDSGSLPIVAETKPLDAGAVVETKLDIEYILGQSLRKDFEPAAELLEIKMSQLWVIFFTPIMFHGLFLTLLAMLVELNTDLAKLLWTRKRPIPPKSILSVRGHTAYHISLIGGCLGWSFMLLIVTYNDNLYKLEFNYLLAPAFMVWELFSFSMLGPFITSTSHAND